MNSLLDYFKNFKFNNESLKVVLTSLIILAVFFALSSLIAKAIVKIITLKDRKKDKKKLRLSSYPFYSPIKLFIIVLGIYLSLLNLPISPDFNNMLSKIFRLSIIWIIARAVASIITPDSLIFLRLNKNVKFSKKDKATTLIFKIIKGLIYLIAIVIIIAELGYDINGLIAGLGVGGLAISLAAQDTLKNLIGGIVVIFDRPFIVGDWIETPTIEGIVEDITFRSTRIRTFKDSIITVPNSTISNEMIINWSRMNKRRITMDLLATFDTPLKNICNAINKIEAMLLEHENVHNSPIYVHFNEIKDDGQNIHVYFYIDRTDFASYLSIKENVNYKVMQILNQEKVDLAYATQTVYLKK